MIPLTVRGPELFCPGLSICDVGGTLIEAEAFVDTGQTYAVQVQWDERWRARIRDLRKDRVSGHGGTVDAWVFFAVLAGLPHPNGAPVDMVEVWAVRDTPHLLSIGLPLLLNRYDLQLAAAPYALRLR